MASPSSESRATVQDTASAQHETTELPVKDIKEVLSPVLSSRSSGNVFLSNNTTDNDCCLRVGFALPEIDVQDIQVKPDLSKFCYKCGNFVPFIQLNGHQKYHKALKVLGYAASEDLETYEQLQLKRQQALAESVGYDIYVRKAKIAQIDSAFDLLKSELDGLRNVNNCVIDYNMECSVKGIGLPSSMQEGIQAIGICGHENARWKRVMEDTWAYRDCFGSDSNQSYFAVFDGYNGSHAAEIAANELHKHLQREIVKLNTTLHCENLPVLNTASLSCFLDLHKTRQLYLQYIRQDESETNIHDNILDATSGSSAKSRLSSSSQNNNKNNSRSNNGNSPTVERLNSATFPELKQAFKAAYADTDTLLLHYGKNEHSRVRWSGCSTLTCIFQALSTHPTDAANSDGAADAEPEEKNSSKRKTIGWLHLANAGNVRAVLVSNDRARRLSRVHVPWNAKEKNRVSNAGGTITGDNKQAKVNGILETTRGLGNHGDPMLKSCITTDPFVTSVEIDDTAQLLIVASHGLWEVLSEQDAADLALQSLPFREAPHSVHAPSSPSIKDLIELKPHSHRLSPLEADTLADVSADQLSRENTSALGDGQSPNKQISSKRPSQASSTPSSVTEEYEEEQWEKESAQDQDGMQTELGSVRGHEEQELDDISVEHEVSVNGSDDTMPHLATLVSTIDRPASTAVETESDNVRHARQISECLVQAALLAGSRNNITVMVILFPAYSKNSKPSSSRAPSRQASEL